MLSTTINRMERNILFSAMFLCLSATTAIAATPGRASRYVDRQSYAYMYPYLNNQMRTELNPGTTINMTNNPIDVIVRTTPMSEPRRVVPRTARVATNNATTARAATSGAGTTPASSRRVVPRTSTNSSPRAATNSRTVTRASSSVRTTTTTATTTPTESVSASRCLADYITCMNGYCAREGAAYNRCYCSSKLSQIDSRYQPEINDLVIQIIKLQGGGQWTDEEMNEYWMELVGNYAGENSWLNLDNALNINWPTADERMRGQNAFITGHQYCVQHLRACSYMSSNLRDAYRSQISRDCDAYEQSMIRIKNAAEALIEYYSE